MKKSEITDYNVDDYIREKVRVNGKRIFWGAEIIYLQRFAERIFIDPIVGFPEGWPDYPNGDTLMGIKHFRSNKKG